MNFKLLIFLFVITACGVKGDPTAPQSPRVPSLIENYPDIQTPEPLGDKKQNTRSKRR